MTIEDLFLAELEAAIAEEETDTGFPARDWMTAGGKGCQDLEWWRRQGPQFCRNFTDWYENNPDVSVWVTPDGRPAIELELIVKFGAVPVRMYIDLVLQIGTALVVVDLKSGAKTPESLSQLSIYASGVELAYGIRPRYGAWFMLRGSGKTEEDKKFLMPPVPLDGYEHSVEWWTDQFVMFDRAVRNKVFVAAPGDGCRRCGVAWACPAVGGKQASQFDPVLARRVDEWQKRTAVTG